MSSVLRIKTTATFKSGTGKCNLKRSQERLKESLNAAHSGTAVSNKSNSSSFIKTMQINLALPTYHATNLITGT